MTNITHGPRYYQDIATRETRPVLLWALEY